VPPTELVIARHDPCPWLPEGGLAEIVLSNGSPAPGPTPVTRLLVTAGTAILAVERDDGRGLDIPSSVVTSDVASALHHLRSTVLTGTGSPRLLGFVRNVVSAASPDYPWPTPVAHFAVWHCRAPKDAAARGRWLEVDEAEARLGGRHWWPLAKFAETGTAGREFL
jgi:hypothetical protein